MASPSPCPVSWIEPLRRGLARQRSLVSGASDMRRRLWGRGVVLTRIRPPLHCQWGQSPTVGAINQKQPHQSELLWGLQGGAGTPSAATSSCPCLHWEDWCVLGYVPVRCGQATVCG